MQHPEIREQSVRECLLGRDTSNMQLVHCISTRPNRFGPFLAGKTHHAFVVETAESQLKRERRPSLREKGCHIEDVEVVIFKVEPSDSGVRPLAD